MYSASATRRPFYGITGSRLNTAPPHKQCDINFLLPSNKTKKHPVVTRPNPKTRQPLTLCIKQNKSFSLFYSVNLYAHANERRGQLAPVFSRQPAPNLAADAAQNPPATPNTCLSSLVPHKTGIYQIPDKKPCKYLFSTINLLKDPKLTIIMLLLSSFNSSKPSILPIFAKKTSVSFLNPQEPEMETPVALNVAPINAPHRDLDYFPHVDKDFQIKDLTIDKNHLKVFCQCRDNYLNRYDAKGLWESNILISFLPSVHVFPEIIHQCHANCDPNHRAVMSPNKTVLFPITVESVNDMLQFHSSQAPTPISIGHLLEKSIKMS